MAGQIKVGLIQRRYKVEMDKILEDRKWVFPLFDIEAEKRFGNKEKETHCIACLY
jgi:hypothetical protein